MTGESLIASCEATPQVRSTPAVAGIMSYAVLRGNSATYDSRSSYSASHCQCSCSRLTKYFGECQPILHRVLLFISSSATPHTSPPSATLNRLSRLPLAESCVSVACLCLPRFLLGSPERKPQVFGSNIGSSVAIAAAAPAVQRQRQGAPFQSRFRWAGARYYLF